MLVAGKVYQQEIWHPNAGVVAGDSRRQESTARMSLDATFFHLPMWWSYWSSLSHEMSLLFAFFWNIARKLKDNSLDGFHYWFICKFGNSFWLVSLGYDVFLYVLPLFYRGMCEVLGLPLVRVFLGFQVGTTWPHELDLLTFFRLLLTFFCYKHHNHGSVGSMALPFFVFWGFENPVVGLRKSNPLEGLCESNSMEEKLPFGFYYPVIWGLVLKPWKQDPMNQTVFHGK